VGLAIRKNENKIQTYFIHNRVNPGICLKGLDFIKVWITQKIQTFGFTEA
jgi:hypothetical protein